MASVSGHQMSDSGVERIMEESSEDSRTERMTTSSSAGHRRSSEAAQDDSVLFYYRTLQWLEAEGEQHTTRLHALTSELIIIIITFSFNILSDTLQNVTCKV